MAGSFQTTTEEMQAASRHVLEVNDSVQGELSRLRNQLAPLAGAWQGSASMAFQQLMERWDTDARNLNEALRGIGEQIGGSAQTYAQRDEEEQQAMSNIANTLNS